MTRAGQFGATLVAAALMLGAAPAAAAPPPPRIRSTKDGAEMVLVPAGIFTCGVKKDRLGVLLASLKEPPVSFYDSELPERRVTLPDYYIDRTEITNERYERFAKETGHARSRFAGTRTFGRERQPVVGVGWPDAEAYCAWAGKRLPTELEWEKAARGTDGRIWPWGNSPAPGRFNGRASGVRAPIDVGSLPAGDSPYGVSDLAGNVWEMTSSPWPGAASPSHAMKGGSFLNTNADVRASVRWSADDEKVGATWLGFRCVMDLANVARWAVVN